MTQERTNGLASSRKIRQEQVAKYVIGADIGATTLRLALADRSGSILERWACATTGTRNPLTVVRLMRQGVDALLASASLSGMSLCAIAAGAPGITNTDSGVVIATSYLMGWREVPLRELLEAEFGVPASVDNDVNLAAIGEHRAGAAQGASDFVFLAVGTGVGAAVMLNGRVHRGANWAAGEIGYMLVPGTSEAPVERGKPGALEGIVGGEGIKTQWRSRWSADLTSLPNEATATEIFDQALQANSLAQEVLQCAARTLAYAVYNTSLVLNSPLFVLGGSVGIHPALCEATRLLLDERKARVQPELIRSALGADAQLTGAVFLALDTASRSLALTES